MYPCEFCGKTPTIDLELVGNIGGIGAHVCQECYETRTIKELWDKLIVYIEESGA